MKLLLFSLVLITNIYANEGGTQILGKVHIPLDTNCNETMALSEALLLQSIESQAMQKCQDDITEQQLTLYSPEVNKLHSCLPGIGGENIYTQVFNCKEKMNPNSLFDGDSSILQSTKNAREIQTPFSQTDCLVFKLTGTTYLDLDLLEKLKNLKSNLSVYHANSGRKMNSAIISFDGLLAISYQKYNVGSDKFIVSTKTGISINELISEVLGKSSVTNYKLGIKILPSYCQ